MNCEGSADCNFCRNSLTILAEGHSAIGEEAKHGAGTSDEISMFRKSTKSECNLMKMLWLAVTSFLLLRTVD